MTRLQPGPKLRGSVGLSSLLSLLVIVAVCVTSAFMLSRFLRDTMLQRDAVITQELVQSIAYSQNAVDYFSTDGVTANPSPLETFFRQIVYLPDVIRGNAFATDGTILWSSSEALIGTRMTDNNDLLRALNGELVIETGRLSTTQKSEHLSFEWYFDHWFVESYIPIRDRGRVVGVVELYKVPRTLSETIANTTLLVWAGTVLGGLLLFALTVWFLTVRSASRGRARAPDKRPATAAATSWASALGMLAVALLGPVILGLSVLFVYEGTTPLTDTEPASNAIASTPLATAESQAPPTDAALTPAAPTATIKPAGSDPATPTPTPTPTATSYAPVTPAANPPTDKLLAATAGVEQAAPTVFNPSQPVAAATAPATTTVALSTSTASADTTGPESTANSVSEQADLVFWQSVADSKDIDLLRSYLVEFPRGRFARIAKLQIQRLEQQALGELLLKAQQALERRALTTPIDDNAVLWAKKMLRIDAHSEDAQAVFATVVDAYADLVRQMRATGRPALATLYLQRAWSLANYITTEKIDTLYALDPERRPGGQ